MNVQLVVVKGRSTGMQIPVRREQFFIGRDPHCQLRPNSDLVSKVHCAISCHQDGVFVRDWNSTNGTFVNNQRVTGEVAVRDGDILCVGTLVFAFKIELPAGSAKPAAPQDDQEDQVVSWLLDCSDDPGSSQADPNSKTARVKSPSPVEVAEPKPKRIKRVDKPAKPSRQFVAAPEAAGELLEKLLEPPKKKK